MNTICLVKNNYENSLGISYRGTMLTPQMMLLYSEQDSFMT